MQQNKKLLTWTKSDQHKYCFDKITHFLEALWESLKNEANGGSFSHPILDNLDLESLEHFIDLIDQGEAHAELSQEIDLLNDSGEDLNLCLKILMLQHHINEKTAMDDDPVVYDSLTQQQRNLYNRAASYFGDKMKA